MKFAIAKGIIVRKILRVIISKLSPSLEIVFIMIDHGIILMIVAKKYFLKEIFVSPNAYDAKSLM